MIGRTRRLGLGVLLLAGLAAVLFCSTASQWKGSPRLEDAADLSKFDPGLIISDPVFYDTRSMAVDSIQDFLDSRGRTCTTNCLKNHYESTYDRPADNRCGAYAGGWDSAAWVIYKVANACGINPQVLLVTLQKEVGLVTASAPTDHAYSRAMGYGCPDSANGNCDGQYYGLYNQLYAAAHQFQNYRAKPTAYSKVAGRANDIGYHPNASCGSTSVYIQNQATAGLYNYTPYVPNAAALAAGYGLGNSCSSYGNRNFYSYFTDWFGSTLSSVSAGSSAIALQAGLLDRQGKGLGAALGGVACDQPNGGCWQHYANGDLFWSWSTGAHAVRGSILAKYWDFGGPGGRLGFPTGEEGQDGRTPNTFYSNFQKGDVIWTGATGAHVVAGELLKAWHRYGDGAGELGLPVGDDTWVAGGSKTAFQRGTIYWSQATGAHAVKGAILDRYETFGGPGRLGFPTGDEGQDGRTPGTFYSNFQNGDVIWTASTGAHAVVGELLKAWHALGDGNGVLGLPVGDDTWVAGGSTTAFQKGSIYWSQATGGHAVLGPIDVKYQASNGPARLGFPVAEQGTDSRAPGTTYSNFQNGDIIWNQATGAHFVVGELLRAWQALGAAGGSLGLPTGDDTWIAGGSMTAFQSGTIYWSRATDAHVVRDDVRDKYEALGGPASALGFPTGDQAAGSSATSSHADFTGGAIYWSRTTGAHAVVGDLFTAWEGRGGATGALGLPTGDTTAVAGGWTGAFENGTVYWSRTTSAHVLRAGVLDAYAALGGPTALGFPTADQTGTTSASGEYADFQRGSIYWSPDTGGHVLHDQVLVKYRALGGPTSALGFPMVDQAATTDGAGQSADFQHGSIYWSPAAGAHAVTSPINDDYRGRGGPVGSGLGYPITDTVPLTGGGQRVDFEKGSITR